MGILSWAVFGLIAGAIAKLLMPGDDPGGCIITMLIGIAGALLGGFLGQALGLAATTGDWSLSSFLTAVAGALVLLFLYRQFAGRGRRG
jgi:uncharacterized membrane protein YeaQ/YmgE (transglycosylase-associated protein family)